MTIELNARRGLMAVTLLAMVTVSLPPASAAGICGGNVPPSPNYWYCSAPYPGPGQYCDAGDLIQVQALKLSGGSVKVEAHCVPPGGFPSPATLVTTCTASTGACVNVGAWGGPTWEFWCVGIGISGGTGSVGCNIAP